MAETTGGNDNSGWPDTQYLTDTVYNNNTESVSPSHGLSLYEHGNNTDVSLRPLLSDKVNLRYFSLDIASQTEVTEIVDLKDVTNVIQTLLKDVANLQKDIHFTKHVMQVNHDSKLQAISLELYCRINEKVVDLEKTHQDRVNCLRKAYRQQLADAVAKLSVHFDKNLQSKIMREQTKQKSDLASKDRKFREMQATILRNEGIIEVLKAQLQQYERNQAEYYIGDYGDDNMDRFINGRRLSTNESSPRVDSALQEELQTVQRELEEVWQKLEVNEKKILGLEKTLADKDEEMQFVYKEMDSLKEQLQSSKQAAEKLESVQNELAEATSREKESANKMLGDQSDEMKHLFDEQIQQAREEVVKKMKQEAEKTSRKDQKKIRLMESHITELEKQLAEEKEKYISLAKASQTSRTLTGSDEKLKAEIKRLQGELAKCHKSWEKKFAILQQSMCALKEESYLRQTLQKQASQLHVATVSYSSDMPAGLLPTKAQSGVAKPLPHIPRNNKTPADVGHIYTIPAPSSRGTARFFQDENQIMTSEDVDLLPADIHPLPPAPAGSKHDCGDESRPSTQSRLLVLPGIQAM
ncbi:hypothetical protein BsWGS_00211 [Bradybaena similaris]